MHHVAKVVEIIGTSEESMEDAVNGALARARKSLDNLQWFEVSEIRGAITETGIRYQIVMRVGFGLNDD